MKKRRPKPPSSSPEEEGGHPDGKKISISLKEDFLSVLDIDAWTERLGGETAPCEVENLLGGAEWGCGWRIDAGRDVGKDVAIRRDNRTVVNERNSLGTVGYEDDVHIACLFYLNVLGGKEPIAVFWTFIEKHATRFLLLTKIEFHETKLVAVVASKDCVGAWLGKCTLKARALFLASGTWM